MTPIYQVCSLLFASGWHDVSKEEMERMSARDFKTRVVYDAPEAATPSTYKVDIGEITDEARAERKAPPITVTYLHPTHPMRYGVHQGRPVQCPPGWELVPEGEYPPDWHLRCVVLDSGALHWVGHGFTGGQRLPARVCAGVNGRTVIAYAREVKS